jgi:hypothetical protein
MNFFRAGVQLRTSAPKPTLLQKDPYLLSQDTASRRRVRIFSIGGQS